MRTLTEKRIRKARAASDAVPEALAEADRAEGAEIGRLEGDEPVARDTVSPRPTRDAVRHAQAHESATKHVTGRARYIDDLPAPHDTLHAMEGLSEVAHGRVTRLDLDAVRAMPGVVDVITAQHIPGHRDIGPVFPGDPMFADAEVSYVGQPLFAVAATSYPEARRAVKAAVIE
ncbi:MAG: xanthine dehydrogenase molybdopterin binding subunit, partial [Salinicola sp.]|nr:xanthine dehydrogenase molybdopterin binding subunit [Salinicola sp.]